MEWNFQLISKKIKVKTHLPLTLPNRDMETTRNRNNIIPLFHSWLMKCEMGYNGDPDIWRFAWDGGDYNCLLLTAV